MYIETQGKPEIYKIKEKCKQNRYLEHFLCELANSLLGDFL